MSPNREPVFGSWNNALQVKAKALHSQIAALERWVQDSGGDPGLLDQLATPYYEMLKDLYEEDFPLARAIETSDILVRLDGPAVRVRSPKVSIIVSVFADVRREIARLAKTIAGEFEQKRVPKQVDLGLAAIARGSFFVGFTLPSPESGQQVDLFGSDERLYRAAQEAVRTLGVVTVKVSRGAGIEELAESVPDPGVRDAALFAVERLAPSGKKGITSLSLGGRFVPDGALHALTSEIRERVRGWVEHPVGVGELGTFEGVVREIDLDAKRFELRRLAEGGYVRCAYGSKLPERAAKRLLDKNVKVTGTFERSVAGRPRLLQVDDIEVLP